MVGGTEASVAIIFWTFSLVLTQTTNFLAASLLSEYALTALLNPPVDETDSLPSKLGSGAMPNLSRTGLLLSSLIRP
jgi:hypothetical protein